MGQNRFLEGRMDAVKLVIFPPHLRQHRQQEWSEGRGFPAYRYRFFLVFVVVLNLRASVFELHLGKDRSLLWLPSMEGGGCNWAFW